MKITMVNEAGNCFKIAETKEKVFELERLGFKKYEEPKPVYEEPKPIIVSEKETAKQKTNKKPTTKKAVKKNG